MLTKKQQLYKNKKTKKKKCKECQKLFAPTRELQPCCSYECEIKHIDSNLNNLVAHGKSIRQKQTNKIKKEFRMQNNYIPRISFKGMYECYNINIKEKLLTYVK